MINFNQRRIFFRRAVEAVDKYHVWYVMMHDIDVEQLDMLHIVVSMPGINMHYALCSVCQSNDSLRHRGVVVTCR